MNLDLAHLEQQLNRLRLEDRETLQRMEWLDGEPRWQPFRQLAGWLGTRLMAAGATLRRWSVAASPADLSRETA